MTPIINYQCRVCQKQLLEEEVTKHFLNNHLDIWKIVIKKLS